VRVRTMCGKGKCNWREMLAFTITVGGVGEFPKDTVERVHCHLGLRDFEFSVEVMYRVSTYSVVRGKKKLRIG